MEHPDKSPEAYDFIYKVAGDLRKEDPDLHLVLAVREGTRRWRASARRKLLVDGWRHLGWGLQESHEARRAGRGGLRVTLGEMVKVKRR